ncbi:MAG: hypothetical protein LBF80_04125, partial [Spirochaetaceae bacterium]|nr:hypothetical protein [Spirochaetaceae bacterium]
MKKRMIAVMLVLFMVLTTLPATAPPVFAEDPPTRGEQLQTQLKVLQDRYDALDTNFSWPNNTDPGNDIVILKNLITQQFKPLESDYDSIDGAIWSGVDGGSPATQITSLETTIKNYLDAINTYINKAEALVKYIDDNSISATAIDDYLTQQVTDLSDFSGSILSYAAVETGTSNAPTVGVSSVIALEYGLVKMRTLTWETLATAANNTDEFAVPTGIDFNNLTLSDAQKASLAKAIKDSGDTITTVRIGNYYVETKLVNWKLESVYKDFTITITYTIPKDTKEKAEAAAELYFDYQKPAFDAADNANEKKTAARTAFSNVADDDLKSGYEIAVEQINKANILAHKVSVKVTGTLKDGSSVGSGLFVPAGETITVAIALGFSREGFAEDEVFPDDEGDFSQYIWRVNVDNPNIVSASAIGSTLTITAGQAKGTAKITVNAVFGAQDTDPYTVDSTALEFTVEVADTLIFAQSEYTHPDIIDSANSNTTIALPAVSNQRGTIAYTFK